MHNYNNLQIWQDAMDVVEMIYQVTACLSMQLQTKLDNLQRMAACFKKRLEYSSINMSNSE